MRAVSDRFESPFSGTAFTLGAILFVAGAIGIVLDVVPEGPVSGLGMPIDLDLELLGIVAVTGAILGDRVQNQSSPLPDTRHSNDRHWDVYISRPLLETLLQFARRSEPESLSIALATTPAGQLSDAEGIPDTIPVFTTPVPPGTAQFGQLSLWYGSPHAAGANTWPVRDSSILGASADET